MGTNQLSPNEWGGFNIFSLMANALAYPLTGREAHERPDTRAAQPPAVAAPRRGLFDRIENWLWTLQQRDVEAYLAKATDLHDLEARIRELERKGPYRY